MDPIQCPRRCPENGGNPPVTMLFNAKMVIHDDWMIWGPSLGNPKLAFLANSRIEPYIFEISQGIPHKHTSFCAQNRSATRKQELNIQTCLNMTYVLTRHALKHETFLFFEFSTKHISYKI